MSLSGVISTTELFVLAGCGEQHAVRDDAPQGPRFEVGHDDDLLAHELLFRVVGFDPRDDLPFFPDVYGELVEAVGAGHFLAFLDLRYPDSIFLK